MKNPRITVKEYGLLKGAINRVFSRSDLRRKILTDNELQEYHDVNRPRVKKWVKCVACGDPTPKYQTDVDHVVPRVPLDMDFKDMSADEYIDRTWCEENLLQPLCEPCHTGKTKEENAIRRKNKKERKNK